MKVTKCDDCGYEIGMKTDTCPSCGERIGIRVGGLKGLFRRIIFSYGCIHCLLSY
jgi:hypothetical protein